MDQTSYLVVLSVVVILCLLLGYGAGLLFSKSKALIPNLRKEIDSLQNALNMETRQMESQQQTIAQLTGEITTLREEKEREKILVSRLQVEKENFEQQLSQHQADVKNMQESFRKDFELLANRIFEEKSAKFTSQNRSSLDQILEPLKVRLKDFQDKVEETHKDNIKETSGLRQEIKSLKETSQLMSREAENLTRALKNDSKAQGNWGEMILESILESSGLVKEREYFVQQSFVNDDGRRLQPDVMVKLPDDKWVIVDSKVSLTAYEGYVNAADDIQAAICLKNHLVSLRNHMKGLSSKDYQHVASGKNLDFILMFIPIEPAYLTALNEDRSLFNDAYEKGIVMVSPTTLIASLKIIATTWKHAYQNKNALDIAERGKILLEKFFGFADDFEKIGEQIDRTGRLHGEAMKKLRSGRGNLVWQAEQLQELGVKTNRRLSANLSQDDAPV